MIVKVMGLVDIIAAVMLFFFDLGFLNIIKYIVIAVLLVKGVTSLFG